MIGQLERFLFFASSLIEQYALIAGWLLFKLGSKWQAWQHISKIPEGVFGDDRLQELRVRHAWSARLVRRFWVGTLYNVLCGFAGSLAAKAILRAFDP